MEERYIGLMSGTSLDGIDAALVAFTPRGRPRLIQALTLPYDDALRSRLLALGGETPVKEVAALDAELGELFGAAVEQLRSEAGDDGIRAIGSHGHTAWHCPDQTPAVTLQIGDPNRIAQATGLTTVADFRRRDMAVGGQGAPLAPAFHRGLFWSRSADRVAINLGGMANLTTLPADQRGPVLGFDTGPANALLDHWADKHLQRSFDADGEWAASGHVHSGMLQAMLDDPYFKRTPPKSTGREHFNAQWLESHLAQFPQAPPRDVQATLTELTARTVAEGVRQSLPAAAEVIVCGGGAYNTYLMQRIEILLATSRVVSCAALGIAPEWVEAVGFAWLARQTLRGEAGNVPTVTGAHEAVVLGGVYPGK